MASISVVAFLDWAALGAFLMVAVKALLLAVLKWAIGLAFLWLFVTILRKLSPAFNNFVLILVQFFLFYFKQLWTLIKGFAEHGWTFLLTLFRNGFVVLFEWLAKRSFQFAYVAIIVSIFLFQQFYGRVSGYIRDYIGNIQMPDSVLLWLPDNLLNLFSFLGRQLNLYSGFSLAVSCIIFVGTCFSVKLLVFGISLLLRIVRVLR